MYKTLDDGRVFINHGPIQMSIDCRITNTRETSIATRVATEVINEFSRLAPFTPQLKEMRSITYDDKLPFTLKQMISAVEITGYGDLNTLAAVAGSLSEYAAFTAKDFGATKVIINNGGDIALYNTENEPIKVGIPVNEEQTLTIDISKEQDIAGICTSGFKGRSFSKGIATFVTVFAKKASVADACATYIANMTNADHPNIIRCLAEEIDEGTDIRGQLITVKIGDIPEKVKYEAVLNGYEAAISLYEKNIIKGAIICIDEAITKVPESLFLS